MIATLALCSPRIIAEFTSIDTSHINENFTFPLDVFSWGLLAICSGYSGIDLGFIKRKHSRIKRNVDNNRIITVIILLAIVLLESTFLNYFLGHDFITYSEIGKQVFKGVCLPLEGISTALVSTTVIYITGSQLISGDGKQ